MNLFVPPPLDVALSLSAAIVESSNVPLLLLDGDLRIIAASQSFCTAFDIDGTGISGSVLADTGSGEWALPQLDALLRATASGVAEVEAYRMELKRVGLETRTLMLNARKLDYFDAGNIRLVLTIVDITEARAAEKLKDDLLREKAILLQEIQHRVANSLQIIASVLMQSARRVNSEESRAHLNDAHHRVMSVAALQKQLASSTLGDVALRPYFTDLCRSIGASMIHDPEHLVLSVRADDASSSANMSVSLGLIVTELVINALKHAFPAQRGGSITVRYEVTGSQWVLSIMDDGIGMPSEPASAPAGLGTTIVYALASQLDAIVHVGSAYPGTVVTITHEEGARARRPAAA